MKIPSDITPEMAQQFILEMVKRGASMEQIAQVKDSAANTPDDALRALKEGNARFYSGSPSHTVVNANQRRAQIMSQTPFAVVLGCSDSRVPVEMIFDQGPGDLFSIRVAGSVVEPGTLGSIEYAVKYLKVHLLMVLGHEGCGAVSAALRSPQENAKEPENVRHLLHLIEPAMRDMPNIRDEKAKMREAVVANVRHQVSVLKENALVKAAVQKRQIAVVGAFYEIGSGAVDFFEEEKPDSSIQSNTLQSNTLQSNTLSEYSGPPWEK